MLGAAVAEEAKAATPVVPLARSGDAGGQARRRREARGRPRHPRTAVDV